MARSPFSLPAIAHKAPVAAGVLPSQRTLVLSFFLVLAGMMAGVLISLQLPARGITVEQPAARGGNSNVVAATIGRLEAEQTDLRSQITDLRAHMSSLQEEHARNKTALAEITDEIASQRAAAGLVPLEGQGVVARFDDSTSAIMPPNEDPANYLLHDYDLRDVVNTLWAAGAEAVSINEERIVATSSLYCVGTTIIANVTRLSPPYVVTAIGDPVKLEAALHSSAQMAAFNQRAFIYDLPISIDKQASVTVPAYEGSVTFRYADASDELSGEPTLTPSK